MLQKPPQKRVCAQCRTVPDKHARHFGPCLSDVNPSMLAEETYFATVVAPRQGHEHAVTFLTLKSIHRVDCDVC